jgi:hypothetical protein
VIAGTDADRDLKLLRRCESSRRHSAEYQSNTHGFHIAVLL